MADFSRLQMKKNEVADFVFKIALWIKNNRPMFFSIAGTVLGIIIFTAFVLTRYYTLKVRACEKLAFAQNLFVQKENNQAVALLDEVINKYSRTPYALQARLVKADYLLSMKDYENAEKILLPFLNMEKPKEIIPLALASLAIIQENSVKYNEAIETNNLFLIKFSEHFMAPKVYESLARVYELTGQKQQAQETYQKLISLYPNTGWMERAQERVQTISGNSANAKKIN